jgi:DNA-binding MurR/RpiR family transcriptional regulator
MRSFFGKLATIDEDNLTTQEKLVVEYLKNNLQNVVNSNMKIERLAQEVGIGYSAIYGLLKKLNINGYRELSMSLSNDLNNLNVIAAEGDENVANAYNSLIKQNYSLIEKKQISDALNLINNASRIFIVY